MHVRPPKPYGLVCALLVAGCTDIAPGTDASTGAGGTGVETAGTSGPSGPVGTSGGLGGTSVAGSDSDSDSDSDSTMGAADGSGSESGDGLFIDPTGSCDSGLPDGVLAHCTLPECSLFDQDCNEGETCRAWANDGGSVWNSTRCVPLVEQPAQPGEPCTAEASAVSGIDSCGAGSMCWDVDPDTLEGVCAPYCTGALLDPSCESESESCLLFSDALPLCLPPCDPLAAQCGDEATCAWTPNDAFACVDRAFVPCPDGTRHYEAGRGPASLCEDDEPCCVPYCNTADPQSCSNGLLCQPFYLTPNPDHPDLGLCWPFGG
ncbi:MAG: hypothetical protein ACRBN8_40495 [Nannocystales bacterium]